MRRFMVTPDRSSDGAWWFGSYRAWIVDADDWAGATLAYIRCVERSAAEANARCPGTVDDAWDGEGRPTYLGVVPMVELGAFATYLGPDQKHAAEALWSLFEMDELRTVAVPPL